MATMVAEVYDALREAGASEEKARQAAVAVLLGDASRLDRFDERADRMERDIADLKRDVAELKATVRVHGWMLGAGLALQLAILTRLLIIPSH